MRHPKISILVAAYNVSNWLEECLSSIENQTFDDFECIVVDDSSTDNSLEIANSFADKDSRFEVVHHLFNQGLVHARRTGYLASKGKYVWYVDGDDRVTNDGLSALIKIMDRDGCDICRGQYQTLENGKLVNKNSKDYTPAFSNGKMPELYSYLTPSCIWLNVFRREFLETYPVPFRPDLNLGEDLVFCSHAFAHAGSISISDEIIYTYRVRKSSYTKINPSKRAYLEEARSHVVCFENLCKFPSASTDFTYRFTPHRMRVVKDACKHLPVSQAREVIETYKQVYEAGFDTQEFSLIQKSRNLNWTPRQNKDAFIFGMMMRHDSSESIQKFYRDQT